MLSGASVEVAGLSKRFARTTRHALRYGMQDILGDLVRRPSTGLRSGEFWALNDVSFSLARGEALGVVGGNGAGKSTLLKLLAGIYKPTRGHVQVHGSIAAVIELGAAFNPLLTGRENIRPQALLHGYSGRGIDSAMDRIIAFADLADFIDSPVQHYSTGMRARLGFSIAVHSDPAVLLIDEVLAVGDLGFQNKCLRLVEDFRARGGTVVFVGHATHQVQAVCGRGLVLHAGEQVFAGSIVDALDVHFTLQGAEAPNASPAAGTRVNRPAEPNGKSPLAITRVRVTGSDAGEIHQDAGLVVTIECHAREEIRDVRWAIAVFSERDGKCAAASVATEVVAIPTGGHAFRLSIDQHQLIPGSYVARVSAMGASTDYPLATSGWEDAPHAFRVEGAATADGNLFALAGTSVRLESHAVRVLDGG